MTKTTLVLMCALMGVNMARAAEPNTPASAVALPAAVATACSRAATEKKQVLLEVFSYNSVESKILRDNVLAKPQVQELIGKSWLLVSCELEREPELKKRFGINRAPTLLMLSADGSEIDRLTGLIRLEEFVSSIHAASEGRSLLSEAILAAGKPEAGLEVRLKLAAAYLKRSQTEHAVAEFSTCLDRAMVQGPDRKYFKFVLDRLSTLGASHPPAVEVLRLRRDGLEKESDPKPATVQMLFAFNEALKQPERNVDYYAKLAPDSALRRQLFGMVFQQLVEMQRYAEATSAIDLETHVNNTYPKQHAGHDHSAHGHDEAAHERIEKIARQRVIDVASAAVQALLATDRLEKAKRIAGRLIETYDGKDTRSQLTQAVVRSAAKTAADFNTWLQTTYPEKADNMPSEKVGAPAVKTSIR